MSLTADELRGHDLWAVQRFQNDTRHMIEFDILNNTVEGHQRTRLHLFLTEGGYQRAQEAHRRHQIKIRRHAGIIEGHIIYDRPRKKRH